LRWLPQGFGQEVTVISTSPKKEKEAREILKADHFVVSKDEKQMSVSLHAAAHHPLI
jgi:cinnamyl-alcohol dehydrogenase